MRCDVIKDLLPLYAAQECSDATREEVEEHIKTCDTCRASLHAMQAPVVLKPAEVDGKDSPKVEAMNFKKGFKKIRRRWVTSIACVILAIPFALLGVNEIRGEGYAYSNLLAVYKTSMFMKKIIEKDYDAAFEVIDVNSLYQSCITFERIRDKFYDSYRPVNIGGETYFSTLPVDTSRTVYSLESTDPAEFWAQMIIDNEEQADVQNPIPSSYMEAASKIIMEKYGKEVKIFTVESKETDVRYAYIEEVTADGNTYYFPVTNTSSAPLGKWNGANYIPESEFYECMDRMFSGLKSIKFHSQTYEKLGIEEYKRLLKEQYIKTLEGLEKQGNYATSYSIEGLYRGFEELSDTSNRAPYWELHVNVQSSFSGEDRDGWQVTITSVNSSISSGHGDPLAGYENTVSEQEQLAEAISCYIYVLH